MGLSDEEEWKCLQVISNEGVGGAPMEAPQALEYISAMRVRRFTQIHSFTYLDTSGYAW